MELAAEAQERVTSSSGDFVRARFSLLTKFICCVFGITLKITLPPDSWEFCPLFGSVCLFAFLALRTRPRDGMVPGQMHRLFSSLEGFQKFFPTPPVSSLSYPQGQLIETVTVLLKPASAALSADNFLRLPKRPRFRNLETVRIQHYPFLVFCLSLLGCHRSRGYAL